jgi:hypothetical protein
MGYLISLPWPASILNGQTHGHKFAKVDAVKKARELAWLVSLADLNAKRATKFCKGGQVGVGYLFFPPPRIRVDAGNMVTACKPYIDGLVDSGVICGDHASSLWIIGAAAGNRSAEDPRVEMYFERRDLPKMRSAACWGAPSSGG